MQYVFHFTFWALRPNGKPENFRHFLFYWRQQAVWWRRKRNITNHPAEPNYRPADLGVRRLLKMTILICYNTRCTHHENECDCEYPTTALDETGKCTRFEDKWLENDVESVSEQPNAADSEGRAVVEGVAYTMYRIDSERVTFIRCRWFRRYAVTNDVKQLQRGTGYD